MNKTLGYISSLLLLLTLLSSSLTAQQPGMRVRGPRIGYDLASLALLYFEPERSIYTFSVDYEAWQDIYPVLEVGYQTVNLEHENYKYGSSGLFARVGVDLNLLKYEKTNVYEMMYTGFRYGISYFTHQAENINIQDPYFGDLNGGAVTENQINAHFISIVGGVKVQLFDNIFMGWSILGNIKLAEIKDENMAPYNIPGFGRGNKRTGLVFNYTIAYRIPLQKYKPKKILKPRKIEEEEE
ncbi:DUF6048 family protein [Bacteroidota bacterium]